MGQKNTLKSLSIQLYNLTRNEINRCTNLNIIEFLYNSRILACNLMEFSFFGKDPQIIEVIKAFGRTGHSLQQIEWIELSIYCYKRAVEVYVEIGEMEFIQCNFRGEGKKNNIIRARQYNTLHF